MFLGMFTKTTEIKVPSEIDKSERSNFSMEKYKYLLEAPFMISDKCCNVMKKNTAKEYDKKTHRVPFIGTMANESRLRRQKWIAQGCNAYESNHPKSKPLSFWTEQDILQYIKLYDLKIAEIYGDIVYIDDDGMEYDNPLFNSSMNLLTTGAKRTGCVFCMFGITQDPKRFINLKHTEPQKYNYVMRGGHFNEAGYWEPGKDENGVFGLGYKFVIDWLNEKGGLNIEY